MTSTIDQIVRQATRQLAAASPTPRLDTEVLVMHVCNLSRTGLITQASQTLPPHQEQRLQELLARRAQGLPVAYLTGRREFWSLDLEVTPDVLIPRPETELLVEQALMRIPLDAAWTLADLGAGSGAVALALAQERPACHILATDISAAALTVAGNNAKRLNILNVEFRRGEWLTPLAGMRVDMIVSNPPYVADNDPHLAEGDVRFEPRHALTSGGDGLDAIRRIVADARAHLRAEGWLLLEHGYDQGPAIRTLLETQGYSAIGSYRDAAGQERVAAARPAGVSNPRAC